MKVMPQCWSKLIAITERLQPPEYRDYIFKELGQRDSRERSWYTCQRKKGILGFLLPSEYIRNKDGYPRLLPLGPKESEGLKTGLLGVQRSFRRACLADLNAKFEKLAGFCLVEIDLVSCHLMVLNELNLGTPLLNVIFSRKKNIWKTIITGIDEPIRNKFELSFLKRCAKRLAYKCVQGGRIFPAAKTHETLKAEESEIGFSIEDLAEAFAKNDVLEEINKLNLILEEKQSKEDSLPKVFAPMDSKPTVLVRETYNRPMYTSNICRMTSQVMTGCEMLQILAMLESMRQLKLPWLPVSYHYDGFALLVEKQSFERASELFKEKLFDRLKKTRMKPFDIEFTPYDEPPIEIKVEELDKDLYKD